MRTRSKFMIVLILVLLSFVSVVKAQQTPQKLPLQCGQIVESETTPLEQAQDFVIQASAGTTLNGRVEPIGSTFNVIIWFFDNGGGEFASFNQSAAGIAEQFNDFIIGSSNPVLRVVGIEPKNTDDWSRYGDRYQRYDQLKYYGAYTIYLGCTLRDGTVINPGDTLPDALPTEQSPVPTELPTNFVGFPGLAPVDFSAVAKIPMIANTPMTGAVAADGSIILGYTLDAAANDTLALSFTRLSGNLNLGLVVLSADNKVVFQASLVTSSALTTTFTLPAAGQYTIGVFRIDLLPPAAPEPTAFQLQATLNP